MDMNSNGTGLMWDFTGAFWRERLPISVAQFVQDGKSAVGDHASLDASRMSATYQNNAQLQPAACLALVAIRF